MARDPDGALATFRVLDLANETGSYCGKLLADLGADVVKVEPPGGDRGRWLPPFYHDEPHPERSLSFFYLNTNKRSITLDLDREEGRQLFRQLVPKTDVVLETFRPGYLEGLDLGYERLRQLNPGLVLTSITPFGQTGPYKHFRGSDLIAQAMGGILYLSGAPEDPPVRLGGYQAHYNASIHGAWGTLVALYHRLRTGEGSHVDVSMQESVAATVQPDVHFWDRRQETRKRGVYAAPLKCKDGYVSSFASRDWDALVAWMDSEGMAEDLTDEKYRDPAFRREAAAHVREVQARFCLQHTVDEICERGQQIRMVVFPVHHARQVVEDPQLVGRRFFAQVEHEDLGEALTYPGAPYRLSATPWRLRCRAPHIGEHNHEVYGDELGLSPERLAQLEGAGVL